MSKITDIISMLATLFMLVTIPIYILFLVTLHKNRKDELLKSPFFRFMFSVGFANMGQIFSILLGNTLASSGFVPNFYIWMGNLSARLYYCAAFGFANAQIVGVTIVAFNRFTAYIYPMKHMKIWTESLTRNLIIFQWISSVLLIVPVAFVYEFNIYIENDNRTIYFQWTYAAENGIYSMLAGGLVGGGMMIAIIIIYAIVFAVALIRKIRSHQATSRTEKTALNMAAIGFICSFGLFLFVGDLLAQTLAWQLFRYNFLDIDTNWMINNVGNSLFAAIDPYAMFLFSTTVRRRFVAIVCSCRKNSGTETTSVTPFVRSNH